MAEIELRERGPTSQVKAIRIGQFTKRLDGF